MWKYEKYDVNWGEVIEGKFALSQHYVSSLRYTTSYAVGTTHDVEMLYSPWNARLIQGPTESESAEYSDRHGWVYSAKSSHAVVAASSLPVIPAATIKDMLMTARELQFLDELELLTDGVKLLQSRASSLGALLYSIEECTTRIDFNVTPRSRRRDIAAAICQDDASDVIAWANEHGMECNYNNGVLWVEIPTINVSKKEVHYQALIASRVAAYAQGRRYGNANVDGLRWGLYQRIQELPPAKAKKLQADWNRAEDKNVTSGWLANALSDTLLKTYMPKQARQAIAAYYRLQPFSFPALVEFALEGAGIPTPWPIAAQVENATL